MVIEPGSNNISNQRASSGRAQPLDAGKSGSGSEQPSAKPTSNDSVSLSSASLAISKIEAKIAESGDVDSGKVADIKAAIDSGSYSVDAQAIADKISLEERFLG
ncbi:MAG: flagellar biosynthesis anti-sigma factor FlgM [Agarilytica sp.]